jgi:hypothetical protein
MELGNVVLARARGEVRRIGRASIISRAHLPCRLKGTDIAIHLTAADADSWTQMTTNKEPESTVQLTLMMFLTLVGLAAAGYAHLTMRRFVATRSGLVAARGILLVVGVAFGYVSARTIADAPQSLAFLSGFGIVHVPAALILLIKSARHSPRT